MNISPILRIRGRVRRIEPRDVPALEAREADYDDAGHLIRAAREARPGYKVHDLLIDTEPGGLISVVFRDEAVQEAGGYLPGLGDTIDVPVRAYDNWQSGRSGRYRTNGYSFAGRVYADEQAANKGGARVAAVS